MEAAAINIFAHKAPMAPLAPAPAAPPETHAPSELHAPPEIHTPAETPAVPAQAPPAGPALSDQEVSILTFERQWWRHAGAKEQAIRDSFGMSPTRYYQTLNAMLDSADAMAHDPALVKRLRRLRASRLRARGRG